MFHRLLAIYTCPQYVLPQVPVSKGNTSMQKRKLGMSREFMRYLMVFVQYVFILKENTTYQTPQCQVKMFRVLED